MTKILTPQPSDLQEGDLVTLTHDAIPGTTIVVPLGANGTLALPGYPVTPDRAVAAGYVIASAERVNRDVITIEGVVERGTLTISAVLPSGAKKLLGSHHIGASVDGTRSAQITKADFDG